MSTKKDHAKDNNESLESSIDIDISGSMLDAEDNIAAALAEAMEKAKKQASLAQAKKEQAESSSDES